MVNGKRETEVKKEPVDYGYCPHIGMTMIFCPKCGNDTFVCYPQSVSMEAPVWVMEYTCERCGHMIGLPVKRDKR